MLRQAFVVLSLALATAGCSDGGGNGSAQGPGGKASGPGGPQKPATVLAEPAAIRPFVEQIEAVGTANARESVTISANVTERVKALNFRDGQTVKKGQVLAELHRSEESADLAEARARLKEAQLQLERIQQLAKQGYATRARLDQQIAERDAAEATAMSIQARIDDRVIRAPFSGVVGLRSVSPGLVVNAGTPLIDINDISSIKLDFTIPESYLSLVRVGQQVQARASAFNNELFTGQVAAIDPQVDPVTRSAKVRALIANPDLRLKPGMLMSVGIVRSRREALSVPELAVVAEGNQKFVYVVNPDGKTVGKTRVLTGERQPGYIEITAGLKPGDLVVTEGTVKLREGAPVNLLTPKAAQTLTAAQATSRS